MTAKAVPHQDRASRLASMRARLAVRNAIEMLSLACPYQTHFDSIDDWLMARAEHGERLVKLRLVLEDLESIKAANPDD